MRAGSDRLPIEGAKLREALEIARRFSTFEATQFINGILDAIKQDIELAANAGEHTKKKQASSN